MRLSQDPVCSGITLEHSPIVQKFTAALGLPEPEVLPLYFIVLKRETVFFEAMDTFQYAWVKNLYEGINSPFCDTSNYEQTAGKKKLQCSALKLLQDETGLHFPTTDYLANLLRK